jgi:SanA protein
MATAAALYRTGKVQKLLLSGDNRFVDYNEPRSMYEYGQRLGLPASAMTLDYAGRRTYDTCRRAREIFGVREAILITQRYHLDRALLTCDGLGLRVQGVAADLSRYPPVLFASWWVREIPATAQALWDVYVSPPRDVVLGEPVPLQGSPSTQADVDERPRVRAASRAAANGRRSAAYPSMQADTIRS